MSVPFLFRRSPYAANSSLRPPSAALVAFEARMRCSPRARFSETRRSAAGESVMASPIEPLGAIEGSIDIECEADGDAAGVAGWLVGAVLAPLAEQAAKATVAAAVSAIDRDFTWCISRCVGARVVGRPRGEWSVPWLRARRGCAATGRSDHVGRLANARRRRRGGTCRGAPLPAGARSRYEPWNGRVGGRGIRPRSR